MAGFWGRSRRVREEQEAADAQLDARAAAALVEADERLRLSGDEVAFATAELGEAATADLRAAIDSVRTSLAEAFELHQLNVDHIPDTPEEKRTRNARIIQLAEWATDLLDERSQLLEGEVSRVRAAPSVIAELQREAATVTAQVQPACDTLDRLRSRYRPEALIAIESNTTEAEQLLEFANHSLTVASTRRDAGNARAGNVALEAASEGVRRARTLLEAVEHFEIEALRAESTLAAVVADSRSDLVEARSVPSSSEVTSASAELQQALDALPAPGTPQDPFAHLSRLRQANSALDHAVAAARERGSRPRVSSTQIAHAIDDAEQQLVLARDVISGHRGYIGADARTRLAESERALRQAHRFAEESGSGGAAITAARSSAELATAALGLAQRDIDAGRHRVQDDYAWSGRDRTGPHPGDWGRSRGRRGPGMGDMVGGLLGGMVLGEILEDLFD